MSNAWGPGQCGHMQNILSGCRVTFTAYPPATVVEALKACFAFDHIVQGLIICTHLTILSRASYYILELLAVGAGNCIVMRGASFPEGVPIFLGKFVWGCQISWDGVTPPPPPPPPPPSHWYFLDPPLHLIGESNYSTPNYWIFIFQEIQTPTFTCPNA